MRDESYMKIAICAALGVAAVTLLHANPQLPATNVRVYDANKPLTFTITWQAQTLTSNAPGWNGYTSLQYDPVSQQVLTYLITNTQSTIYSTDWFAYRAATNAWTRLGGTRSASNLCNDGTASDVQPWPSDRHPVAQMAVDTTRSVLWLYNGVCQGIEPGDLWMYSLHADPKQNRWTKVPLSVVPNVTTSGALAYDPDDDVLILAGPNSGSFHRTWIYCPSPSLSAAQTAAGCVTPRTFTLIPETDRLSYASFPQVVYDRARQVLVEFLGSGPIREIWEYRVPTRTWTNRAPSGLPADVDGASPEQSVAAITSGPYAGKFVYHQTAHMASGSVGRDYLYDPVANKMTALKTEGLGPDKFVFLTWDANAQRVVAWSYNVSLVPDVWRAALQ